MLKSAIALIWYRVLWLKWELSLVTLDGGSRTDLWQAGELQVRTSRWIDAILLNMFSFTALVTSTFIIVTCIYKNNPKGKGSLSAGSTDLCDATHSIRDPSSGLSAWLRLKCSPPRLSGDIHLPSSHLHFITGQDCCERQSVLSIIHLSANRLACLSQILQHGLQLTLLLIYFRIRYIDTPHVQIHMFLVSMHLNWILKNGTFSLNVLNMFLALKMNGCFWWNRH